MELPDAKLNFYNWLVIAKEMRDLLFLATLYF